ncbi:MAG TPA: serine/threonine-protein kinase, partial [Thermoanaerobaculaceae bacterium]|nr:serine/threonine-protein kinase [Thermoanaerobaculaceae bacterium]
MTLSPGTRLGSYEILSLIDAGGMGEVYLARDDRLARDVAIKTISPRLAADQDAFARFEREGRATAALSHPNILTIYDIGRDGETAYLVTELLSGETLRARLSRSALPWTDALEIAAAVTAGLVAAHARDIIHRDLKPENVFLTADGRV